MRGGKDQLALFEELDLASTRFRLTSSEEDSCVLAAHAADEQFRARQLESAKNSALASDMANFAGGVEGGPIPLFAAT